jgi:hypothetical protein
MTSCNNGCDKIWKTTCRKIAHYANDWKIEKYSRTLMIGSIKREKHGKVQHIEIF